MTILYLDVETIHQDTPEIRAELAAAVTAPGQYKKADSIAEWLAANRDTEVAAQLARGAFDAVRGQIVCIGYAIDDAPAKTCAGNAEDSIIGSLYNAIQAVNLAGAVFVGHNIAGFDLPFLRQRSIILGIKPPSNILQAMQAKAWDKSIADTMLMWSTDRDKRISLDKLCKVLSIPTPKGDMDGSKVWQAYKDGKLDEIAAYCRGDVEATRAVYKRLTWA